MYCIVFKVKGHSYILHHCCRIKSYNIIITIFYSNNKYTNNYNAQCQNWEEFGGRRG